jgi:hypothetical protein
MGTGFGARMSWNKFLHQERIPVCTVISVVTTVAVEAVVVLCSGSAAGYAAIGAWVITYFMVFVGVIINIVAGWGAYRRRECWGVRIAIFGMATWFATLVAFPVRIG